MHDSDKWQILQEKAKRDARRELLDAFFAATGLDDYIADAIARHESQMHDDG
jgi:hypothetical protein